MTKYLVEEQTLTDIADAIREQTGDENPIMLSNFASEIGSIQGGGSVNYSTTEHEIGTWVDGSTLYERTHHIIPSSPIQPQTETTLNLPDMTDADIYFYIGVIGGYKGTEQDVAHWVQFTFEGNRNDATAVCVRQNTSSSLVVWTGSNSGYFPQVSTDNRICEFYITVRYTKKSA